jgi:hypothetical protein
MIHYARVLYQFIRIKGKAVPLRAPGPLRPLKLLEFPDNRHMKMVRLSRLSALHTGRLNPRKELIIVTLANKS